MPAAFRNKRSELGRFIETISQFHVGGSLNKLIFDFIVGFAGKKQIVGSQAALTGHAVAAPLQPVDDRIHITARHDQHMVFTVAVNRCLFSQLAGQCEKLLAHRRRANEADALYQRMGQYLLIHIAAAVYEVHQSGRKSFNFGSDPENGIQTHRIIFTGADDHRTAAGNGIGHKRRPGVHRYIIGRNNQKYTPGLPVQGLIQPSGQFGHIFALGQQQQGRTGRLNVFNAPSEGAPGFSNSASVILHQHPAQSVIMFFKFAPQIE